MGAPSKRNGHGANPVLLEDDTRTSPRGAEALGRLSPREQQVFALLLTGRSNREIGLALGVSYLTVKVHVKHLYAKIGVTHRVAAILWAAQFATDKPQNTFKE